MIKFKKTSSSPPLFVYFTVHFDDDGEDLNTYPDHVDPEVYDAHEAFEIDKTKMKMLVPLDMNGKKILNTSFDLKFGDIFKIINCYIEPISQSQGILKTKSDNQVVTFSIVLPKTLLFTNLKTSFSKALLASFLKSVFFLI